MAGWNSGWEGRACGVALGKAVFARVGRIGDSRADWETETSAGTRETVTVNAPCILLLRECDNMLELAVASPEHREMTLRVDFSFLVQGQSAQRKRTGGTCVTIKLPGGPLAGSCVIRRLQRKV